MLSLQVMDCFSIDNSTTFKNYLIAAAASHSDYFSAIKICFLLKI